MSDNPDEIHRLLDDVVHLARLALSGRPQDVQLHVRRLSKRLRDAHPEVSEKLLGLLRDSPTRSSPLRGATATPLPVDQDSRLPLLRCDAEPALSVEPVFEPAVRAALEQLLLERRGTEELHRRGLAPSRTVLFVGNPGVGKSLAAKWLARELELPLLTLDLSAVMSSFLGRTGTNLRHVLEYAKSVRCVLLLDELDAVAKRRDDQTEVGELKRLVTVLLQEIDDWPGESLLIAATNHAELLDPAVWRRFDMRIDFPMPDEDAVKQAVLRYLGQGEETWAKLLSVVLKGASFSDIERSILRARRLAALSPTDAESPYLGLIQSLVEKLPKQERTQLAIDLTKSGIVSQRQAHEITGISRDTIRDRLRDLQEEARP